ncbi:hypothetical protein BD324DRAFT_626092 [Kockovaella imperatae]|uniref:PAS domain-containing protein n=1 Tax=Kockovaella imperatae TaxID=4999 RepID=A0A1Y1UH78_9TREE|nr:hypothetical protein BD324DRAFT_626092 [Kockovaella imperatae]ORX37413.1 hypothetical protein BD324DRAFT_626092 [Kockovaella imperatae]
MPAHSHRHPIQQNGSRHKHRSKRVLSGLMILSADRNLRFIYTSHSMRDILGYTWEELSDIGLAELWHPEERSALENKLDWTLANQTTGGMIFQSLRHQSGEFIRCCLYYHVVYDQIMIITTRMNGRPSTLSHSLTNRQVYETIPPDTPGGMWSIAKWTTGLQDLPRIVQTGLFILAQPFRYISTMRQRPHPLRTFLLMDRFTDSARITYVSNERLVPALQILDRSFYSLVAPLNRQSVRHRIDCAKRKIPVLQEDRRSGLQDSFRFSLLREPHEEPPEYLSVADIIQVEGIITAYSDGLGCLLIKL